MLVAVSSASFASSTASASALASAGCVSSTASATALVLALGLAGSGPVPTLVSGRGLVPALVCREPVAALACRGSAPALACGGRCVEGAAPAVADVGLETEVCAGEGIDFCSESPIMLTTKQSEFGGQTFFGDKLRGDELGSAVRRYYPVGTGSARYFSLPRAVVLFSFAGSTRCSLKIGLSHHAGSRFFADVTVASRVNMRNGQDNVGLCCSLSFCQTR